MGGLKGIDFYNVLLNNHIQCITTSFSYLIPHLPEDYLWISDKLLLTFSNQLCRHFDSTHACL